MLRIKTLLKNSSIHGFGVFADQDIEKGTIIWRFDSKVDVKIKKEEAAKLFNISRKYLEHYGYESPVSDNIILCSDNAKYMNHSDEPNTVGVYPNMAVGDDIEGFDIAARDIKKGEEITTDYKSFDKKHFTNKIEGKKTTEGEECIVPKKASEKQVKDFFDKIKKK